MHLSTTLTFLLATSALALPEPVQSSPNGSLEARDLPFVDHWESIYDGAASSVSPLSSLAILTVAAMTMPLTTALTLGFSSLSLVSASPVAVPESPVLDLQEKRQGFEGTQINGGVNAGQQAGSNGGAISFGTIARSEVEIELEKRQDGWVFPGFEGTQLGSASSNSLSTHVLAAGLLAGGAGMLFW